LVIVALLVLSQLAAKLSYSAAHGPVVWWTVMLAGFFIFGIEVRRLQRFRCPRCAEVFVGEPNYRNIFPAEECVHCGLPKFSEDGN
jgi:hypothetical protein